jgi:hypothetical protein
MSNNFIFGISGQLPLLKAGASLHIDTPTRKKIARAAQ